jgi:hypothetical protein
LVISVEAISATSFGLIQCAPANRNSWRVHRCRLHSERPHQLAETENFGSVEPGADLARMAQLAALIDAEKQRAEPAAFVGGGPTDHDELLTLDALGLEPRADPRPYIARLRPLGDHAFQTHAAETVEQLFALADDIIEIMEDAIVSREQCLQLCLALKQGRTRQVLAVEMQQVERVKPDGRRSTLDRRLERLEARLAGRVQHHGFAVDQGRFHGKRRGLAEDRFEWCAPVEARPGKGMACPPATLSRHR